VNGVHVASAPVGARPVRGGGSRDGRTGAPIRLATPCQNLPHVGCPARVLEFGIYQGGSLLLMHKAFGAGKVVGIDLGTPVPALQQYLNVAGLTERIVAHFATNQADASAVRMIIAQEFGGEPIDIVIDDASHDLALTRASFNLAFPYLKAGGLYIIEDWGWAHWKGTIWQTQWIDQPALSNLVFELVMACTSSRETIARIDVSPYYVAIRKGPAAVDPATFDLASLYVARGKHLTLI
jgi:hypothetical protein